ncbi:hypothetical protein [Nitrospira sp. Nam74]
MNEQSDELRLYGWPPGRRHQYVTKRVLLLKAALWTLSLGAAFGLGAMWGSFRTPIGGRAEPSDVGNYAEARPAYKETTLAKDAVRLCCLKDIRSAQEALTNLATDAGKLRVRLTGKESVRTELVNFTEFLENHARAVWDQFESLLDNPQEHRQQLRDIRINLARLKEQLKLLANCCGLSPGSLPSLKHELETAESLFRQVQAHVVPSYVEGEIDPSKVSHEAGYSYVFYKTFESVGDTMGAPNASSLRIYEDGVPVGPAHSQHLDIRRHGRGRYSHWGNTLYFSASDNSNPITNKRRYTYRAYSNIPIDRDEDTQHQVEATSITR